MLIEKPIGTLVWAIVSLAFGAVASAATYNYTGVVFAGGCTTACDLYDSLADGTRITGTIDIDDNAVAGGAFDDGVITAFSFALTNPFLPPSGPGDPVTDNPLLMISGTGVVRSNGSHGTTDGTNLTGGSLVFEFLIAPFSSNGAFALIDIATGDGAVCGFYSLLGCPEGPGEPPAGTQFLSFVGDPGFMTPDGCPFPDTDGDGVPDMTDTCTLIANPAQRDTDGDGFGNFCDPDLNNDGIVNAVDLGLFKLVFFTADPDADLNGNGLVNAQDLGILKSLFFKPPGPGSTPYVNPGYSTAYDFQRIDPLGNGLARVFGVDDNGNVTGRIDIGGDDTVGFILDVDSGVITYVPELSTLFDLNNAGRGVGILWDAAGVVESCFIREIDGTLTPFSPYSQTSGYAGCQGRGINNQGIVSGFEHGDAGWMAFSYDSEHGAFEEFLPTAADEQTFVGQINDQGQLAGSVFYRTADQICPDSPADGIYGFRRDANGFLKFFTIDGNLDTRARGIADNGQMTGFFTDESGFQRSYVAVVSDGPGFEDVTLPDYELMDTRGCIADPGPVPYPAEPGQEWIVDADSYGAAIRGDGAVVGNCDGFYVLLDGDDNIIDFVYLGSAGFIATPIQ